VKGECGRASNATDRARAIPVAAVDRHVATAISALAQEYRARAGDANRAAGTDRRAATESPVTTDSTRAIKAGVSQTAGHCSRDVVRAATAAEADWSAQTTAGRVSAAPRDPTPAPDASNAEAVQQRLLPDLHMQRMTALQRKRRFLLCSTLLGAVGRPLLRAGPGAAPVPASTAR
jgi:hypothetical protein